MLKGRPRGGWSWGRELRASSVATARREDGGNPDGWVPPASDFRGSAVLRCRLTHEPHQQRHGNARARGPTTGQWAPYVGAKLTSGYAGVDWVLSGPEMSAEGPSSFIFFFLFF
jgi:predicted nucleic acid-binding Zn ribbon protein